MSRAAVVFSFRGVLARTSVVTGNARFGISTRPDGSVEANAPCTETAKATIALHGSTVTGNGIDAGCGTTQPCADLATCGRPPLRKASSCDTSYLLESGVPGATLGVCGND